MGTWPRRTDEILFLGLCSVCFGYVALRALQSGPGFDLRFNPCSHVAPSPIVGLECRLQAAFSQNYAWRSFAHLVVMICIAVVAMVMSSTLAGFWRSAFVAIVAVGLMHAAVGFFGYWVHQPQILPKWVMVNANGLQRFTLVIPHPSWVWPQLSPALAIAVWQLNYGRGKTAKAAGLAGAIALAAAICATGARGGLLLVGIVVLLSLGDAAFRLRRRLTPSAPGNALLGAAVLAALIGSVGFKNYAPVLEALSGRSQIVDQSRLNIWTVATGAVLSEHPLAGFGYASWVTRFRQMSAGTPSSSWAFDTAHNLWVQLLFELGATGLLLVVGCLIAAVYVAWRNAALLHGAHFLIVCGAVSFVICASVQEIDYIRPVFVTHVLFAAVCCGLPFAGADSRSHESVTLRHAMYLAFACISAVLIGYETYMVFGKEWTLRTEGERPIPIEIFAHGAVVSHAFLMDGDSLRAVSVRFTASEHSSIAMGYTLSRLYFSTTGAEDQPNLYTDLFRWSDKLEISAGDHWRRIDFPRVVAPHDGWYKFELRVLDAAAIGAPHQQPATTQALAIMASADNPLRGGKLWVGGVRQPGSLYIRTHHGTLFDQFRLRNGVRLPAFLESQRIQVGVVLVFLALGIAALKSVASRVTGRELLLACGTLGLSLALATRVYFASGAFGFEGSTAAADPTGRWIGRRATIPVYGPEPLWIFRTRPYALPNTIELSAGNPVVLNVRENDAAYLPMYSSSRWWPSRYRIAVDQGFDDVTREIAAMLVYPPMLTTIPLLLTRGASEAEPVQGGCSLICADDCMVAVLHSPTVRQVALRLEPVASWADNSGRALEVSVFATFFDEPRVSLEGGYDAGHLGTVILSAGQQLRTVNAEIRESSRWYRLRFVPRFLPSASSATQKSSDPGRPTVRIRLSESRTN